MRFFWTLVGSLMFMTAEISAAPAWEILRADLRSDAVAREERALTDLETALYVDVGRSPIWEHLVAPPDTLNTLLSDLSRIATNKSRPFFARLRAAAVAVRLGHRHETYSSIFIRALETLPNLEGANELPLGLSLVDPWMGQWRRAAQGLRLLNRPTRKQLRTIVGASELLHERAVRAPFMQIALAHALASLTDGRKISRASLSNDERTAILNNLTYAFYEIREEDAESRGEDPLFPLRGRARFLNHLVVDYPRETANARRRATHSGLLFTYNRFLDAWFSLPGDLETITRRAYYIGRLVPLIPPSWRGRPLSCDAAISPPLERDILDNDLF